MELTEEDIKEINGLYNDNWVVESQGIYRQPWGAPDGRDELFVYMRWASQGYSGGNCWGDDARYYKNGEPEFKILDDTLQKLCPNITFLDYKKILGCQYMIENSNTENGYYGNSDEYVTKMIALEDLIKFLKELGYK